MTIDGISHCRISNIDPENGQAIERDDLKNTITQKILNTITMRSHRRGELFNFKRIWLLSFLLTSGFAIIPVIFFAVIDYNVTKRSVFAEAVARTSRLTSNSWRSVAAYLNERQNALEYIVRQDSFEKLNHASHLNEILSNLKKSFGGFTDLGLIDADGLQRTYVGPYPLEGKNYSNQPWFKSVVEHGKFISEVFLGFRNEPHLIIAIKHESNDGNFYILRATIEHQLTSILSEVKADGHGFAFLINTSGILQTPSPYFGKVLDRIPIPVPAYSKGTELIESQDTTGQELIIGYRYIPDTPFILMIIKDKNRLMEPWRRSRMELIQYLAVSITIILLWILGVITFLIRRLKLVDQRRIKYLHIAEYSNKLASIGRLAAGVAHEINNPLAIINEKAGLIKDIFSFKKEYQADPKLIQTVDSILHSVERCSRITRQLLSFARHMNVTLQRIDLKTIIQEVLGFLAKEAEYRAIHVIVDIADNIPEFETDRGKLQQILLNIINNAFASLSNGGAVRIHASRLSNKSIQIEISDTGCGISQENLNHIFEPFFSTKTGIGGTGLGLSITYSLVQELGGRIEVASELNQGTTFTIRLPLKPEKEEQADARTTSG